MAAPNKIALIGLGSIGISFAALYLRHTKAVVSTFDPRPDLEQHLHAMLPVYLGSGADASTVAQLISDGRLQIASSIKAACADADIVQEQGPENPEFKIRTWTQVEEAAPKDAHFWSSTSGIPASYQVAQMADHSRLLVVHPFNPPHIMPLIEISPGPETRPDHVEYVRHFFTHLGSGHRPIVLKKEVPGFVGNRLAMALLREACHLVNEDVIDVHDLDVLVESSIGPRWAIEGPFRSYAMGGGAGGIQALMKNLAGSVQRMWDDQGQLNILGKDGKTPEPWMAKIVSQTDAAYGLPTPKAAKERDEALVRVLKAREVPK